MRARIGCEDCAPTGNRKLAPNSQTNPNKERNCSGLLAALAAMEFSRCVKLRRPGINCERQDALGEQNYDRCFFLTPTSIYSITAAGNCHATSIFFEAFCRQLDEELATGGIEMAAFQPYHIRTGGGGSSIPRSASSSR